jgi:Tfp pilus assembly protein PilF
LRSAELTPRIEDMMASVSFTLAEAIKYTLKALNEGRLSEAEELCRAILAVKEDSLDALHLLAVVQSKSGLWDVSVATYDRVLALRPVASPFMNSGGSMMPWQATIARWSYGRILRRPCSTAATPFRS